MLQARELFSLSANLNLLFVRFWRHLAPGFGKRRRRSKKHMQMQM